MRKCLLLALLLLSFIPFGSRAQNSLFDFETDTVCVGQQVRVVPRVMNASSYYWGFCSGYLQTLPLLDNLGANFQFDAPASIVTEKDGDNYYGFVVNGGNYKLLRLNYGTSLLNIPTVTDFGNLDSAVTPSPNSLHLVKDSGKWFLFMCGGGGTDPSTVSRIDFGASLANVPNGVRMGNPGNLLNDPRGIFVSRQGDVYYGFVVNAGNSRLIRLNFGNNISRTPTATAITPTGSMGVLNGPRDIAAVYDQGSWYFFVANLTGNTVTRLFFGNSLSNNPVGSFVSYGNNSKLNQPSSINIIKDCSSYYAFVTNRGSDTMLRFNYATLASSGFTSISPSAAFGPTGIFNAPADMSRVVRDRDSLYAFVVNATGNTLTRLIFSQCHDVNIQSSTSPNPPSFSYDTAGLYNVYLAVNEGQPNMAVDCKQVLVVNVPPITISRDTLICQGDTLRLTVASQFAENYFFSPNYNISNTQGINIYVYPDHSFTYNITVPFPNGCIVDTNIRVDVSRVQADAGPDRTLYDGASTIIGGPTTYLGPQYSYEWFPTDFMDNPYSLNPTVRPRTDITYYLRVTNTDRCVDIDTVVVRVTCADLNLPNAYAPDNSQGAPKLFGLLNRQIVQLNYFRIFDRWGKEVFTTTDLTKQWDGNVGGKPAPFGVYVWEADGFCESGTRLTRSGNVTLMR